MSSSYPNLPVECPKCGHKFVKDLTTLKDETEIPCPSCGQLFNIEKLKGALEKASESFEDTKRRLKDKGFKINFKIK
jgi:DNA-directed RNA polymerase subunit RPC12/RpoP